MPVSTPPVIMPRVRGRPGQGRRRHRKLPDDEALLAQKATGRQQYEQAGGIAQLRGSGDQGGGARSREILLDDPSTGWL
jgi:hypothetical protein